MWKRLPQLNRFILMLFLSIPCCQLCHQRCQAKPFPFLTGFQVVSLPAPKEEKAVTSVNGKELDSTMKNTSNSNVHFVLEESSGYMELCLHFLSIAHTIISFCCIIGYYCLKVCLFNNVFLLPLIEL